MSLPHRYTEKPPTVKLSRRGEKVSFNADFKDLTPPPRARGTSANAAVTTGGGDSNLLTYGRHCCGHGNSNYGNAIYNDGAVGTAAVTMGTAVVAMGVVALLWKLWRL